MALGAHMYPYSYIYYAPQRDRVLHLAQGIALPTHYTIQGTNYDIGYYLSDSIYPKWSTLVQSISNPQGPKRQYFAMMQEACRKDVERAFGVLQLRFTIIKRPACYWEKQVLHDIISTCIIMHNIIVEDEYDIHESIVDLNVMLVPKVDMIVDKIEYFNGCSP